MFRRLVPLAVVVLAAVPAAQAKAPPYSVSLCGSRGACVAFTPQDNEWVPWYEGGAVAPGAPAPYYVVRYRWHAADPEQRLYWIPSSRLARDVNQGVIRWFTVNSSTFERYSGGVAPFRPALTRVTVAGRAVRAPATYLRLFAAGRATHVFPAVSWLRIRLASASPSPWTEPGADVRVSTTGGYLLRDGTVFAIPTRLANRVRRRLSLAG
jgi:hypothetical protein